MTQHHLMTSLTLTILLMSPPLLAAAVTPSAGPPAAEDIEVVKVTSTRLSRDLFATPAAVSLLDARQELQLQEALQLNEALKFVPGVYFQNRYNFAQNLRISIRGFGSRAHRSRQCKQWSSTTKKAGSLEFLPNRQDF